METARESRTIMHVIGNGMRLPVTPDDVLTVRRQENDPTLWFVFVKETKNLILVGMLDREFGATIPQGWDVNAKVIRPDPYEVPLRLKCHDARITHYFEKR